MDHKIRGSLVVIDDDVGFDDLANYLVTAPGREDSDDGFYMMNIDNIIEKYEKWVDLLPRIRPFYAIKANPDPVVVRLLSKMGIGFDCASKGEIKLAFDNGSIPQDIVYAHTCKKLSHIRFAEQCGVSMMTFDCESELHKIKQAHPESEILLRFAPKPRNAVYDANGLKFGVSLRDCNTLLTKAKNLGLNVVGVSFHVGSGCLDVTPFQDVFRDARYVFDIGEKLGFCFNILDIGGGFPGKPTQCSFEMICDVINPSLDKYFPVGSGVKIIAEPGTYFPTAAYTLVSNVTTVKERHLEADDKDNNYSVALTEENSKTEYMYYIDDGVYSSFLLNQSEPYIQLFDKPKALKHHGEMKYPSRIWGQTCCSYDCLNEHFKLPKLSVGDWMYFENMGVYTSSTSTLFNGFPGHYTYYYVTRKTWVKISKDLADFDLQVLDFSPNH